jgi:myb proto-oncogene protein
LRDGVREHGGKNWKAIAALVIGRTKIQCRSRWQETLVSIIDPTITLAGKWTADEDKTLTDAVRAHGGKNWKAITALVLGRTREQCRDRWYGALVSNIDPTTARAGKWTADEDKQLRDGVREHGGKNWKLIAAFVPGRTKSLCYARWHLQSQADDDTCLEMNSRRTQEAEGCGTSIRYQ